MKKPSLLLSIFIIICTLSSCGVGNDDHTLIVAGSTSVQPYVEVLAEEFENTHSDDAVDVQGGGSASGITAATSEIADIAMSSRALQDAEKQLWSVEIAKDGLAIILHESNPVENLTIEQLRGIYSLEITNWKQVGGNDAKIHIITREEGSGTRSAFEELVMGKTYKISNKAIVLNSNGSVGQIVSGDKNAIGFMSLGLLTEYSVTAIKINHVTASDENVLNGSYSLYRPFLFVAKKEPSGLSKKFVDFVLSAEGKEILNKRGLIA